MTKKNKQISESTPGEPLTPRLTISTGITYTIIAMSIGATVADFKSTQSKVNTLTEEISNSNKNIDKLELRLELKIDSESSYSKLKLYELQYELDEIKKEK